MEQKITVKQLLYFGLYRANCQVLWNSTDQKPLELWSFINTQNPDLKLTMEIRNQSIWFLDLRISFAGNELTTTVFSNPIDSHSYLHAHSWPKNLSIKSVRKYVALSLRRICSSDNDFTGTLAATLST